MAFFKFRFPGHDDQAQHNNDSPHESLEALRKRVKHRLIGSGVLVLIAVIGFPLVFDTQPRPVGLDIPIDIPDKAKTAVNVPPSPLKSDKRAAGVDKSREQESNSSSAQVVGKSNELNKTSSESKSSEVSAVAASSVSGGANGSVSSKPNSPGATPLAPPTAPSVPSAPASSPQKSPPSSNASNSVTALPAHSTLDSKEEIVSSTKTQATSAKSPNSESASNQKDERFVIQVGAYSDEQKVKEIREKLEKAGLHTYTQVVEKDGKKIRIRIGPFTSKEDANRQLQKVKNLNLQPNLLTL
jgi:DedD protein